MLLKWRSIIPIFSQNLRGYLYSEKDDVSHPSFQRNIVHDGMSSEHLGKEIYGLFAI